MSETIKSYLYQNITALNFHFFKMTYILIFEQIQATEIQMSACKILKQALKNRGKFLSRCVFVELFAFMNIQVVHENTNLVALFLRKYKLI